MALTAQEITRHINKLLLFLEPVYSLANSHFVSFFDENLWSKNVPFEIQSELSNLNSVSYFTQVYPEIIQRNCPNEFSECYPNLCCFIETAMNISVTKDERFFKLLLELENLLLTKGSFRKCKLKEEDFMSQKKMHEVEVTSRMAAFVSEVTQSSHIVDVGGGKGYLSCILALYYSFKVLGLDSSEVTTCGAVKRSEKVAKLWNCEILKDIKVEDTEDEVLNKKAREELMRKLYKQSTTFVKPDTNIEGLLKEGFKEDVTGVTLTGLHTCGDLSPTSLRMFVSCKKIKGLINVGCCYNHISEEFDDHNLGEDTVKEGGNFGFPMSNFLRKKNCVLGQNARMLAAHSLDRLNPNSDFEVGIAPYRLRLTTVKMCYSLIPLCNNIHFLLSLICTESKAGVKEIFEKFSEEMFSQTSLFYRAVLEVVKKDKGSSDNRGQVGRLARKCSGFHEYMGEALKKLGIGSQPTKEDLDKLYERYAERKPYLTAFYFLRITLAPVVESIILLDRILYLLENGIENAYLVPLFNLEISPRGFGIIAWKDCDKT